MISNLRCPAFSFWRAQKSRIWAMGTHGHINALVLCKIDFTTVACGIQAFSSSRPKCNPALYQGKNKGEMSLHIDFIFIEHWMDPYVHHFSNIKNSWTCLMFILKRSNLDQIFRFTCRLNLVLFESDYFIPKKVRLTPTLIQHHFTSTFRNHNKLTIIPHYDCKPWKYDSGHENCLV